MEKLQLSSGLVAVSNLVQVQREILAADMMELADNGPLYNCPKAGLSRDWGSGCGGHWRERVIGGVETLPEAGAERAVVDGAADLEQPVGAAPGPTHLLRLGHPAVHQEVGRALGQRGADP